MENGDKFWIELDGSSCKWEFGCLVPERPDHCIVFRSGGHMVIPVSRLMREKPETQEEKRLREIEELSDLVCEKLRLAAGGAGYIKDCGPIIDVFVRDLGYHLK